MGEKLAVEDLIFVGCIMYGCRTMRGVEKEAWENEKIVFLVRVSGRREKFCSEDDTYPV